MVRARPLRSFALVSGLLALPLLGWLVFRAQPDAASALKQGAAPLPPSLNSEEPVLATVSPTAAEAPSGESAASLPDADDYLRKLEMLAQSDKPAALAYARQGEDWYGDNGVRAEARCAMAITLLVDLDRMKDARREVRQFIQTYPESRYRPLVQGVTGIHPRPGAPEHLR